MRIVDFPDDDDTIRQGGRLLVDAFVEMAPGSWPDLASGIAEVKEMLAPDRVCRAAMDGARVLGWIGGIPQYHGHVLELHPIVVDPSLQRTGIGTALVRDLEDRARERGAHTITLGSDDVAAMTSLGDIDLYPDPLEHLRNIRNLSSHPFEFYLKVGFALTGVLPDANGPGKPDIYLSKRVPGRGP